MPIVLYALGSFLFSYVICVCVCRSLLRIYKKNKIYFKTVRTRLGTWAIWDRTVQYTNNKKDHIHRK